MENGNDEGAFVIERIPHHSLQIASVNLMHAPVRLDALIRYINEMVECWDVIALQDLPKNFPWRATPGYDLHYTANREIHERDFPRSSRDKRNWDDGTEPKEPLQLGYVGFYIAQRISSFNWSTSRPESGINRELVATLHLVTENGTIDIHNIYNHHNQLDLEELFIYAAGSRRVILVGDFNIEHPDSRKADNKSRALGDMIAGADMECLTPSDKVTYSRSVEKENRLYCSTIDLIFVSRALLDCVSDRQGACKVLDVRGFETDHRVTETTMDIMPCEVVGVQYAWQRVDQGQFRKEMRANLDPLGFPPLNDPVKVDEYTVEVVKAIGSVVESQVKTMQSRSFRPQHRPPSSELEELGNKEAQLLREYVGSPSQHTQQAWRKARDDTSKLQKRKSKQEYREKMTEDAAKPQNTVYKRMKRSARRSEPRRPPQMPSLKIGDRCVTDPEEKARCLVDGIWSDAHPVDEEHDGERRQIPKPDRLSPENELECDQTLLYEELSDIIKDLKTGRSSLPDGIGNEALIICRLECLPYLLHLFSACLSLGYHPEYFKNACTVMLRKPDKTSYDAPKSWRPVALLSCVGKVLEKVMANKIRDLAIRHNLLPKNQYAAPGRSTTKALQFLVNIVYRGWSFKCPRRGRRLVSILGFDITGAYDRIPCQRLLETLLKKGMPYWIVLFCWSFLSGRTTNLRFPGHESKQYAILVGIPQGSPLSPILFLLFIAGLLESHDGFYNRYGIGSGVEFYTFGFADDHYIVAISTDYRKNCEVFEVVTEVIMGWAKPNSVTFNPAKYIVMHLRRPRSPDSRLAERDAWKGDAEERKSQNIQGQEPGKQLLSPVSDELPNIEGVTLQCLVTQVRILGVIVDDELTWGPHIHRLKGKVYTKLGYMRRIGGPTWGTTMWQMRQIYLTSIRPVIAYGCPAWFVSPDKKDVKWRLSKDLMAQLETLQYHCLLTVSGAMERTPRQILLTELGIPSLEVYLDQSANKHRMLMLNTPTYSELGRIRRMQPLLDRGSRDHPLTVLFREASELRQLAEQNELSRLRAQDKKFSPTPEQLRKAIDRFILETTREKSNIEWENYISKHKNPLRAYLDGWDDTSGYAVLRQTWDQSNFKLYKELRRPESTMLLHCRTGCIRLRKHLHSKLHVHDAEITDSQCPCGTDEHTALHLFLDCPKLEHARQGLKAKLQEDNLPYYLPRLLSEKQGAGILARWAVEHFGIEQFKDVPPPNRKGNASHKRKHHNTQHNQKHKEEQQRKKRKGEQQSRKCKGNPE